MVAGVGSSFGWTALAVGPAKVGPATGDDGAGGCARLALALPLRFATGCAICRLCLQCHADIE
jgi:hypothetical protein